jgi:hypothetical protein
MPSRITLQAGVPTTAGQPPQNSFFFEVAAPDSVAPGPDTLGGISEAPGM